MKKSLLGVMRKRFQLRKSQNEGLQQVSGTVDVIDEHATETEPLPVNTDSSPETHVGVVPIPSKETGNSRFL